MPGSRMPSRFTLARMSGDMTRQGRAVRGLSSMSRQSLVLRAAAGDPFLGGLLGAIGKGLGAVGKIVLPAFGINPAPRVPAPVPDARITIGPPFGLPFPTDSKPVNIPITPTTGGKVIMGGVGGAFGLPARAGFRRRRRMNPLNPRALRRALSRASAFSRFARRTMRITFGKTPKGRFRLRRKRAA